MSEQELNEHMARLMGWAIFTANSDDNNPPSYPCLIRNDGLYVAYNLREWVHGDCYANKWNPCQNESQAWLVVERIIKNDPEYADYVLTLGESGDIETGDCYMFQLFKHPECRKFRGVSSTRALSICHAMEGVKV